jgi:prepilin signal peptidase PulO-like enzyme (type II secretory pathway)
MMLIVVFVTFVGICLGSFVNALIWRTRQRELLVDKAEGRKLTKAEQAQLKKLSITTERSRCTHCEHELAPLDLVPVLSYLGLRGKCRYCGKKIEDTPIAELLGGALALGAYLAWPFDLLSGLDYATLGVWLIVSTLLLALAIYDARWQLLPNRIVAALSITTVTFVLLLASSQGEWGILLGSLWGGLVIGGLFYLLFQMSKGKWIGGGDVKIGFALGAIAGGLTNAFLLVFAASLLGTLYACAVAIATHRPLSGATKVPFGPFLIIGALIAFFAGVPIVDWYQDFLLNL